MLREIKLRNFRGFYEHQLFLRDLTVIVGKNNAGKTSLVEALRLLSIVVSRYRSLTYRPPPAWTNLPRREYGVTPSLRNLEINFQGIFHRYNPPPAIVEGVFNNGSTVSIYLNENEEIHATIRDSKGNFAQRRDQAINADLPLVSIMPQVTPVQLTERILNRDYVHSAMSSALSSLHFRNQLNWLHKRFFAEFQGVVEDTWPGVRVEKLYGQGRQPGDKIDLHIRNEDFVGEIGLMGHGLQMWLQTMWFLTRSAGSTTVILDEPDVYMHPDLQRRVIRFLRNRYPQTILTTHSIEIMAEVEPENILIVDKAQDRSDFASSLPAVQKITSNIGSVHNVHLSRLWTTRRFLLLEGNDIRILKHFQDILFPNSNVPLETIPQLSIDGWGGWTYAIGSSMALQNAMGEEIQVYCILDRDYHTEGEIEERMNKATERGIHLHIWSQKEIENYLISPTVIHRYITNHIARAMVAPSVCEVNEKIETVAWAMEDDVFDSLSNELLPENPSKGSKGSNVAARRYIKPYKDNGSIVPIVSGKSLLSKISSWSKSEFGVQISATGLTREFHRSEIDNEVVRVITAIEQLREF